MTRKISKSQFKPRALEFFRLVEESGSALIITDHGRPVLKIVPYDHDPAAALRALRRTVLKYENPTDPVGAEDWDAAT